MSESGKSSVIRDNLCVVVCALCACLAGGGIYWTGGEIEAAAVTLEQSISDGTRLQSNIANAAQLPDQVQQLTAALSKIQTRFVRPAELATNLQYFYRLENESGVELVDLRQTTAADPLKGKAGSRGVAFSVTVRGSYEALIGWLRRLENGRHFSRITTATMGMVTPDRTAPLTLNVLVELLGEP
jgi:hypothetical protein